MRCHLNEHVKSNSLPPDEKIWTSPPSLLSNSLRSISDLNSLSEYPMEQLSPLCTLDSLHLSHKKRKIVECEKDDIGERFWKLQRKKELRRVTARASLVVDDREDERDEEDQIYEQMDWLEKESESVDLESDDDDYEEEHSGKGILSSAPAKGLGQILTPIPRVKWKEERRRLLKISMAKIRCVDDPEAYLRRSVLINNTVKRLQKDVAINYQYHSIASSSFVNHQENMSGYTAFKNESINSWEFEDSDMGMVCKRQVHSEASVGFECTSFSNSVSELHLDTTKAHIEASCNSLNFHLSFASSLSSSAKPLDVVQQGMLHTMSPILNKSCTNDKLIDPSMSTLTLKHLASSVNLYPSQPCGLQYRNPIHAEEVNGEYTETNTSTSLIDSVVYHSLIASLES